MSEQETAMTVQPQELPVTQNLHRPMTVNEVLIQSQIVQQVLAHCMVEGIHYGKIPGTDKKTLLQPGAEKICTTFRLAPKYDVEDLSEPHNNFYRYRVRCNLYTISDGLFVGSAVGECSSLEEKYQWEAALSQKHFDSTDPSNRRIKFKAVRDSKGKKTDEVEEIYQVRTNAADVANTVLKIGAKRSLISSTRGAVGASDLLDVDLDEEAIRELHLSEKDEANKPAGKLKAKARPAPTFPFGPSQGKQINDPEVPLKDLEEMLKIKINELADQSKKQYHARSKVFADALQAEINYRKAGQNANESGQSNGLEASRTGDRPKPDQRPTTPKKAEKPEVVTIPDHNWSDLKVYWEEECTNSLAKTLDELKIESLAKVPAARRAEFRDAIQQKIRQAKEQI